jgi:hypothetical protein
VYTRGSPVEIQTPTQQNLIGRSKTAPPPVLSPSGTPPPPSSHWAFIPAKEARLKELLFKLFLPLLKLPKY